MIIPYVCAWDCSVDGFTGVLRREGEAFWLAMPTFWYAVLLPLWTVCTSMTGLEEKWGWKDWEKDENLAGSLKTESPFLELLLEINSAELATSRGFEENCGQNNCTTRNYVSSLVKNTHNWNKNLYHDLQVQHQGSIFCNSKGPNKTKFDYSLCTKDLGGDSKFIISYNVWATHDCCSKYRI